MASFQIQTVPTKPYPDQKPGTSGLRKKVAVFREGHYLHNFVQSLFNSLPANEVKGSTLVIGGDGRFWNTEAVQIIIKIAAGNGVGCLLIGKNGVVSTPAVSSIIRGRKAYGGILLTASHNPGGEDKDFGIKYNTNNGGPAPEKITDAIYEHSKKITEFKMADLPNVDLSKIAVHKWSGFEVQVIDQFEDYLKVIKQIFDFNELRQLIARSDFKFIYDSMHGVTGPYCRRIFVEELGAAESSLFRSDNLPDFGHCHPDPNLTYADELVKMMYSGDYAFGCASDGDGDRNMILGNKFFVTPSDSVAIIAANSQDIPYFRGKLKGVARSMPTGAAIDRVAEKLKLEFFEVPTGWKFFGNLMDAGRIQICGEESFGTGSDHIREKDGVWAVLCWLQMLAVKNKSSPIGKLVSVEDIVKDYWRTYGRNFFSRYDYEEVSSDSANQMMAHIRDIIADKATVGKKFGNYTVKVCDDFEYKDPIDHSISKNQGMRFVFEDGSRIVFRLSGTGSSGATIRVYVDKYVHDESVINQDAQVALKDLIAVALDISQLAKFTGRTTPTVIT
eukprot:TRINITY_DN3880_c0_g1_i1.p1 TRINITY_DN3880_c0_g1~~TRINITY_DN3880_c0_g1_i1.p1  ORF type:complete len:559 (+),score=158.18 TRINITY_DN3880_c0_g1_i1:85-1761(+)